MQGPAGPSHSQVHAAMARELLSQQRLGAEMSRELKGKVPYCLQLPGPHAGSISLSCPHTVQTTRSLSAFSSCPMHKPLRDRFISLALAFVPRLITIPGVLFPSCTWEISAEGVEEREAFPDSPRFKIAFQSLHSSSSLI